jgi:hypothetical protein
MNLNLSSASRCEWCLVAKSSDTRYTPRPDATLEGELDALAACYRFILFESKASKKGAHHGARERPERIKDDPARSILHE